MKNHNTVQNVLTVNSYTVSRNRVRICTRSLRHLNVKPGERVMVVDRGLGDIEVLPNKKGNYKVEKDGSVRFPAHKFGLNKNKFDSHACNVTTEVLVH